MAAFGDGVGAASSFNYPMSCACDSSNNVIVADWRNNRVRRISPAAVVSTIAGSGASGFADGSGTAAVFNGPIFVHVARYGGVFVADESNKCIRFVTDAGFVATIAGSITGVSGYANGFGLSFIFTHNCNFIEQ